VKAILYVALKKYIPSYLDISEMTNQLLVLTLFSIEESLANIFTLGSHGRPRVSMNGMKTWL